MDTYWVGDNNEFEGFYNGDYHRILNLHIKREIKSDARYIGFISRINVSVSSAGLVRLGIIGGEFTILDSSQMGV
jgi:hypothetical protein